MMYSIFGFYMTWCLLLWDSQYIIHNEMAFPQENIVWYIMHNEMAFPQENIVWYIIHNEMAFPQENIILLYHSMYWFSWLFQKDPFIQKHTYYHGVIFAVFFN